MRNRPRQTVNYDAPGYMNPELLAGPYNPLMPPRLPDKPEPEVLLLGVLSYFFISHYGWYPGVFFHHSAEFGLPSGVGDAPGVVPSGVSPRRGCHVPSSNAVVSAYI